MASSRRASAAGVETKLYGQPVELAGVALVVAAAGKAAAAGDRGGVGDGGGTGDATDALPVDGPSIGRFDGSWPAGEALGGRGGEGEDARAGGG